MELAPNLVNTSAHQLALRYVCFIHLLGITFNRFLQSDNRSSRTLNMICYILIKVQDAGYINFFLFLEEFKFLILGENFFFFFWLNAIEWDFEII